MTRPRIELPVTVHGPIAYLGVPTSDGRRLDRLTVASDRTIPVSTPATGGGHDGAKVVGVVLSVEAQPGGLVATLAVKRDAWVGLRRRGPVRAAIEVDVEGLLVGVALLHADSSGPIWPGDTIMEES